jgi:hypothetical protein
MGKQLMLKRLLILIGMGLGLAGCVLQSHQPLFSENDGVSLPKALGTHFVMENFDDGAWAKEEGSITLKAIGHHYVATDEAKKDEIAALFVPLDKNWWVMQAQEKDKPSVYILAQAEGNALLLTPLTCEDLKLKPAAAAEISFEGDDCYLKGGQGVDYFKALMTTAKPAQMRLSKIN